MTNAPNQIIPLNIVRVIKRLLRLVKFAVRKHYWALCPNKDTTSANICLSSTLIEHDLLLPLLEVIVYKNKKKLFVS